MHLRDLGICNLAQQTAGCASPPLFSICVAFGQCLAEKRFSTAKQFFGHSHAACIWSLCSPSCVCTCTDQLLFEPPWYKVLCASDTQNGWHRFSRLCPLQILPSCIIPQGIKFWGVDSGVRHSVGGNDYGSVRAAAFMGLKIISSMAEQRRAKQTGSRSREPEPQTPSKNPDKAGGHATQCSDSLSRTPSHLPPELPNCFYKSCRPSCQDLCSFSTWLY